MLTLLPLFDKHILSLEALEGTADADAPAVLAQLRFFVRLLRAEYASKLETLADHLAEKQITFDLIPLVFVPGNLLITHCDMTGEPLIVRLVSCTLVENGCGRSWTLKCDVVGIDEIGLPGVGNQYIYMADFEGAENIVDLSVFPMAYLDESRCGELRAALAKRGRRYWELSQKWCHKQYDAVGYAAGNFRKVAVSDLRALWLKDNGSCCWQIQSRIMLDRGNSASILLSPVTNVLL